MKKKLNKVIKKTKKAKMMKLLMKNKNKKNKKKKNNPGYGVMKEKEMNKICSMVKVFILLDQEVNTKENFKMVKDTGTVF